MHQVIFLLVTLALCCNGGWHQHQPKWRYLPGAPEDATQYKMAPPPPPPPAQDYSITVDAIDDTEAVFDLMNPNNNQEVGTEIDDMQRLVQIVPDAFAVTYFNLEPCGVFYPHLYPDADAVYYFIESNPDVEVGYVADNGTSFILTNLEQGNTFTAAKNLLHWSMNKSCFESASLLQFFNSPNIDSVRPDTQVGSIPEEILEASMGEQLASQIASWGATKVNPLDKLGRCPICMRDCGLY